MIGTNFKIRDCPGESGTVGAYEEEVYDAHGSRVMEIIERLEQLQVVEESVSRPTVPAADPSHSLTKRLRYLERERQLIVESSREILYKPESHKRLRMQKNAKRTLVT